MKWVGANELTGGSTPKASLGQKDDVGGVAGTAGNARISG